MTTTDETKPAETRRGWSALAKGFAGTALVAVAGFVGTAAMNVLSAPKDSVAYDLIQSMTGMLRKEEAPPPKPAERVEAAKPAQVAVAPVTKPAAPPPAPTPRADPPPAAPSLAATPAPTTHEPPPASSMADRLRATNAAIDKARAATAALAASRILTLQDRAETPICGTTYRLDVTSVEAGRGEVALRSEGHGPLTLAVGQPRDIAAGCRVELIGASEDLTNRRAQLRETMTR